MKIPDFSMRSSGDAKLNCNADATNRFYGNRGALQCLTDAGDVAVLELQYLKGFFHFFLYIYIICLFVYLKKIRNFDVDNECRDLIMVNSLSH